jgi:peptide/nickel transport system permease protein
MREALGLGEPTYIRFGKWLWQFFVVEPLHLFDIMFGTSFAEGQQRVISWQTRSPVMDIVAQRIPQTLWVVGVAYLVAIAIACRSASIRPTASTAGSTRPAPSSR